MLVFSNGGVMVSRILGERLPVGEAGEFGGAGLRGKTFLVRGCVLVRRGMSMYASSSSSWSLL